jgi:methyl-accepting chemotaxis protein
MKTLHGLSLGTKLYGMTGVLLALMVLLAGISLTSLGSVNETGGSMYSDRTVPIRDLAEVRALLGDIDSQIQRAITDSDGDDTQYVDTVAKDVVAIDKLIKAYEATFLVQAEKDGLRRYHDSWNRYQKTFNAVLEHASPGDEAAATREYFARADSIYAENDGDVAKLIGVNDKVAKSLNAEIGQAATSIADATERSRTGIVEVASVAEQSSALTEQVSAASEQTSASAQEISASAAELARTAQALEELVSRFTLKVA